MGDGSNKVDSAFPRADPSNDEFADKGGRLSIMNILDPILTSIVVKDEQFGPISATI